jgi:hypothetical protein
VVILNRKVDDLKRGLRSRLELPALLEKRNLHAPREHLPA